MSKQPDQAAPGHAPSDKTSADGNVNRGEQRAQGNAGPGAQSSSEASRDSSGQHGGNRGGGHTGAGYAKGSSHRGDQPSADQRNQGGGADNESKRRTQPIGDTTDYGNGNAAPSSANDGGRIDDADNS